MKFYIISIALILILSLTTPTLTSATSWVYENPKVTIGGQEHRVYVSQTSADQWCIEKGELYYDGIIESANISIAEWSPDENLWVFYKATHFITRLECFRPAASTTHENPRVTIGGQEHSVYVSQTNADRWCIEQGYTASTVASSTSIVANYVSMVEWRGYWGFHSATHYITRLRCYQAAPPSIEDIPPPPPPPPPPPHEDPGDVYYYTQCGEQIEIGRCWNICCRRRRGRCRERCRNCSCRTEPWYEYRASTVGCDPEIQKRRCEVRMSGNCRRRSCVDENCEVFCGGYPSYQQKGWETCEDCGSWQKAERTGACPVTRAGLIGIKPNCFCKSDCIDAPLNPNIYFPPRYYDNSIYPPDPWSPTTTHEMASTSIFLPVKIDWDDVRGWEDGWRANLEGNLERKVVERCSAGNRRCIANEPTILSNCKKECRNTCFKGIRNKQPPPLTGLSQFRQAYYACLNTCETTCENTPAHQTSVLGCTADCPYPDKCFPRTEFIKSYVITIEGEMRDCATGATTTNYTEVLTNRSEWMQPCPCFFKSNATYTWHIKACCGADGKTGCGATSSLTFKTNAAPELVSPFDLDWNGQERTINVLKKDISTLKWCEIDDAKEWVGEDGGKYRYPRIEYYDDEWKIGHRPHFFKILIYYTPSGSTIAKDLCHPGLQAGAMCEELILERRHGPLGFKFKDEEHIHFTKKTPYAWKVSACEERGHRQCTNYSQLWRFEGENFTLPRPAWETPPDDKKNPIPLPVLISWSSPYAMSWHYEVTRVDTGQTISGTTTVHNVAFTYNQLALNTVYKWRVQPCWDYKAERCEGEALWSSYSYFKTGLPPPNLILPFNNSSSTFPVFFDWDDVYLANSYVFQVSSTSSTTTFENPGVIKVNKTLFNVSQASVDFPNLKPEKEYWWRVGACRDIACGAWSEIRKFGTLKPGVPSNPSPADEGTLYSFHPYDHLYKPSLSWSPSQGGKFYQVTVAYGPDQICQYYQPGTTTLILTEITSSLTLSLPELKCEGRYFWTARACLDAVCNYPGDWAGLLCPELQKKATTTNWGNNFWGNLGAEIHQIPDGFQLTACGPNSPTSTSKIGLLEHYFWSFNFVKPVAPPGATGGLVPCNRAFNNPATPWDERKPCQIQHLFYLLIGVLDFVLWRLGLLILVFLMIASALILYLFPVILSEQLQPIIQVKSLWRAAGIGYLIIFLAWSIINLILILLDYQFQFFGRWWQIPI